MPSIKLKIQRNNQSLVESFMKKIVILSTVACLLISSEASARVDLSVGLFAEPAPAYVEAPVYVGPPIYPSYVVEGGGYYGRGYGRHDHRGHSRGHHR